MPSNMFYSPAQIVFGLETVGDVNKKYISNSQIKANQVMGSTSFIGGGNNITISAPSYSSANPQDIIYIITNKTRVADIITIPNQVTFTGGSFPPFFTSKTIFRPPISAKPIFSNEITIFLEGWKELKLWRYFFE